MPLITRTLKGSKLSIEEMDGNLLYLETLAISNLRDYVQLQNRPLVIDNLDRWNTTKELKLNNHHLYIDGPYTIRFTNHLNEGGPNYLFRAWDWDGPSSQFATPYQDQEVVYNERAQISFLMEDTQKSSLSLKSFDWSGGSQSGVEFDYKFYQGSLRLPINGSSPETVDGSLAFSDGISWNPGSTNQPQLNVRLDGQWKQVNFGAGVTGPTGPIGSAGPQGVTGPSFTVNDFGLNKLVTSDGSEGGLNAQSNLTFDGLTFSIIGDLNITGTINQPTILSPTINFPTMGFAKLEGDTTLQNISTVLVDTIQIDTPTVDFDFNLGSIFYISTLQNDFEVNLQNLPTANGRAINITVFIQQDSTPFGVNGFKIDGTVQTLKWIGGTQPTPLPFTVTTYIFNLLRSNNSWVQVLGSIGIYA